MKIRYIRDWQNGRTVNGAPGTNCDWRQIMAIDYFGKNIAKDKADNGDFPGDFLVGGGAMWHFLTDENFNTTLWTKDKPNERKSVTIDLGDIYDIDKLVIARAKNPAICKETKTEVSVDNIVWHTIFDSSVEGTYEEQQNGREFKLQDNRFNIPNQDSSLGEIISFFDDYSEFNKVQKNVLKNNLIDKGVEVTDNDKMSTLIGKIGTIGLGKKWAEGTGTYQYGSGARNKFTVRNLSFRPKIIMIYYRSEEDSNERVAMYNYDYNRTYMAGGYINYNFTPTYPLAKQKITHL